MFGSDTKKRCANSHDSEDQEHQDSQIHNKTDESKSLHSSQSPSPGLKKVTEKRDEESASAQSPSPIKIGSRDFQNIHSPEQDPVTPLPVTFGGQTK